MPRPAWLSLAVLCLAAAPALSDGGDIPRTASGHPDLSGVYNVATLTPLQRPDQFEGKATLTDSEAEAIAERWRRYMEKDSAPSDPNRTAPPAGGTEFYIPNTRALPVASAATTPSLSISATAASRSTAPGAPQSSSIRPTADCRRFPSKARRAWLRAAKPCRRTPERLGGWIRKPAPMTTRNCGPWASVACSASAPPPAHRCCP